MLLNIFMDSPANQGDMHAGIDGQMDLMDAIGVR